MSLSDLEQRARETVIERGKHYGPAIKTAERFARSAQDALGVEVEPEDYPRLMIHAKLARDPALLIEDTRLDIVGYLQILESMQREGEG